MAYIDRYGTKLAGWVALAPAGVAAWPGPSGEVHRQVKLALTFHYATEPNPNFEAEPGLLYLKVPNGGHPFMPRVSVRDSRQTTPCFVAIPSHALSLGHCVSAVSFIMLARLMYSMSWCCACVPRRAFLALEQLTLISLRLNRTQRGQQRCHDDNRAR